MQLMENPAERRLPKRINRGERPPFATILEITSISRHEFLYRDTLGRRYNGKKSPDPKVLGKNCFRSKRKKKISVIDLRVER